MSWLQKLLPPKIKREAGSPKKMVPEGLWSKCDSALESAHALAYASKIAPRMRQDQILLVNLSGRGDKDMQTVAERSGIKI